MADRLAMYIDTSKCMACRGCQVACKQWNDLSGYVPGVRETKNVGTYENPLSLDPQTWTRITFQEYDDPDRFQWLFLKQGCMHCTEAGCIKVCPTANPPQSSDHKAAPIPCFSSRFLASSACG